MLDHSDVSVQGLEKHKLPGMTLIYAVDSHGVSYGADHFAFSF